MIHITCTNCQTMLEIDDAFAGGVCRCQHCGTIQTVPAHFKGNATAAAASPPTPAAGVGGQPRTSQQQQKSLYQNQQRSQRRQEQPGTGRGGGTGLDELSDAVLSSGLGRSGLRRPGQKGLLDAADLTAGMNGGTAPGHVDYATPELKKNSPTLWILLGAGGVLVLLLLVLAGFFLFARASAVPSSATINPSPGGRGAGTTPEGDGDAAADKNPHFCGIDLSGATGIVYLLDRGSASGETLDTLKAATYRSLESLGASKQFAVIFWEAGSEGIVAYPDKGLLDASPANVTAAEQAFEDVVAQGRSDPIAAITSAAARVPSDVIFVTAKGDEIGDDVMANVDQSFSGAWVHTVAIGDDLGTTLKEIAKQRNGTYQMLTKKQLDAYSRPH